MGAKFATYYDILRVDREAAPAGVRAAYRSLAQKYHPDKLPHSPDDAQRVMAMLNEAYAVLSDPDQRARYDRSVARALVQARPRAAEPLPELREASWPWWLLFATISFSATAIGTVAWRVAFPVVAVTTPATVQASTAK